MIEYGIFNDDGCLEREFYNKKDAEKVAKSDYSDDDVSVLECCPDHPEEPKRSCYLCDEEAEELANE